MIKLDYDNLNLLIQALDFWIQDSVLPAFPKSRISRRKANNWNTTYLCMTREWKMCYKGNKTRAICQLIIDHYKYVLLVDNGNKVITNNHKYLFNWYNNTLTRDESWI